jgi:hypothetical protein
MNAANRQRPCRRFRTERLSSRAASGSPARRAFCPTSSNNSASSSLWHTVSAISIESVRYSPKLCCDTYSTLPASWSGRQLVSSTGWPTAVASAMVTGPATATSLLLLAAQLSDSLAVRCVSPCSDNDDEKKEPITTTICLDAAGAAHWTSCVVATRFARPCCSCTLKWWRRPIRQCFCSCCSDDDDDWQTVGPNSCVIRTRYRTDCHCPRYRL